MCCESINMCNVTVDSNKNVQGPTAFKDNTRDINMCIVTVNNNNECAATNCI